MFDEELLLDSDDNLIESSESEPTLVKYDSKDSEQSKAYLKLLLNFFGERSVDDEIRMFHELDTVRLLESNGVYKGFIVYRIASNKVIYVRLLGILTKYRGAGLGRKMLDLFIEQIREEGKFNTVQLTVNSDSIAANHLYDNMGFKTVLKAEVRRMEFKL